MKSNTFNYSLLAVGVAALMGVSTGAMAAKTDNGVQNGVAITNTATANYSVGGVTQLPVKSNEVIVNVNETPNFSLVNITDGDSGPDTAINQEATPGGSTLFTHLLTNEGNITDTYTIATNATDTSIGGTPDYTFDSANVSYSIDVSGLTTEQLAELQTLNPNTNYSVSGTTATGTLTTTNDELTLLPGLVAELSYNAPTDADQDGGDTGEGNITATSSVITGTPTLTNQNQTLVRLPVFAITKSATCEGNTPCTSLNLNADNNDITYTITVENVDTDYSANATNVVFRDILPAGMTLKPGTVRFGGAAIPDSALTITEAVGRQTLQGTLPQLNVGESISVVFEVTVDEDILSTAGTATNNVTLYDNFDASIPNPEGNFDISDSTDDDIDTPKVPDDANGAGTDGQDTSSTITFVDRSLTITPGVTKEVPVEGSVGYSHTIENAGNANEGGTTRPINITITDPNGDTPLDVINPVYVDSNNVEQPLEVVDAKTGQYKLPDTVILAPNEAVVIRYTVDSVGDNTNLDDSDTNVLTVTSTGTDASSDTAQNTTTIKGLTLLKQAALQIQCTGNIGTYEGALGSSTTATFTAQPGDCIYYQITATNTFTNVSNTAINNVVVSDKTSNWGTQATYTGDTDATSSTNSTAGLGTDSEGDAAVTTNLGTLASGASANLTFAVKVNP
ncbi:hypothetical protein ACS8FA_03690 [Psychrobacter sp. 1Y1]|uniref:hypothetical protein n=1 Tax=Psychrobacter sp. 1Y1 TaxID=3453574 RepID=UPI003F47132D